MIYRKDISLRTNRHLHQFCSNCTTKYLNYFQTRTGNISSIPTLFQIQMDEEKKHSKVRSSVLRKFCFWKWKKRHYTLINTDENSDDEEMDTESFKLQDLTWEAWRQETKAERESADTKPATTFHRRGAVSEELEKHIWFNGYNLHEIRRYIAQTEVLKSYELY